MNLKRRKLLKILGVSAGAMAWPLSAEYRQNLQLFRWEGYALGADTEIQLYASNKSDVEDTISYVTELIAKLEGIFSLYDPESEINMLNSIGALEAASADMIELINISKSFSVKTNGAFDVTVQPLWELYDRYRDDGDQLAFDRDLKDIVPLIGSDKIKIDDRKVTFFEEGMAISFNGIAQGYITDKAVALLKENGFTNTLVDVGEYSAGGPQWGGDPWRIGLLDPFDQISVADVLELNGGGLATSGGYGTVFADDGSKHHLFNPITGLSANQYASVTVTANNATTADALSTAFSNMSSEAIKEYVKRHPDLRVRLTHYNGEVARISP